MIIYLKLIIIKIKEEKEVNIIKENKNEISDIKTKEDEKNIKEEKINNKENNDTKLDNLRNAIEKEKQKNKKNIEEEEEIEDDIKIEDTIDTSSSKINNNINNNINTSYNYNNINNNINYPPRYSEEYINQAKNQLNNMSDEQLQVMLDQMKNMDNQTLKNLMAAQGMNMSDDQINMMKNSLSPQLLRMAQNQNFQPAYNNNSRNNSDNNNINTNINNNTQQPQMPNLNNMDFSQMMEFIKKNPEILKMISPQLSKMMGGKDIDPEIMMKSMENIMWIFSIPGRIKRFMLSWRGICFIVFIIAILYGIFKR